MRYDDFDKDDPLLMHSMKIMIREQDIDFFEYENRYEPL